MHARRLVSAALAASPLLLLATAAGAQVTAGQVDDFEDGTTQGWIVPDPTHPAPPMNLATGGPGGADDAYLRLTSLGGGDVPGSRLSVINFSQWAGDYRAAGVGAITMDVRNIGTTDLYLRLLWANPFMGPPTAAAMTLDAVLVPAGTDWTRIMFDVGPGGVGALFGDAEEALTTATELRIIHAPAFFFGGPGVGAPVIVAELGVDNITAVAVVPEPSTILLLGSGALLLVPLARRRRRDG